MSGIAAEYVGAPVTVLAEAFEACRLTSADYVAQCLTRIEMFDRQGPALGALLCLNPAATAQAHALDGERRRRGPRSPLHGVPIILKDNIDTADLPTTAGSVFLDGHRPRRDAALVASLRDAGMIVLAKANMSEFALSSTSSLGGRPKNPHDLARATIGSSSGSAVAVAACYAPLALGTDTGGSIRGPASALGITSLKPTHGLLSDDGIIPFARSLDVPGPMARYVDDLRQLMSVLAGTRLQPYADNALSGARIGVARDFTGVDREVDWLLESALATLDRAGARLVDLRFPRWLLETKQDFYLAIRHREFKAQIAAYLVSTGAGFPKTLAELAARARAFVAASASGPQPNPSRWATFDDELAAGSLDDADYHLAKSFAVPMIRQAVDSLFTAHDVDAIAYLPMPARPPLVSVADVASHHGARSPTNIANLTGFPDLTVPAGVTSDGLPAGISFLGRAGSEARLFAIAHGYEQATRHLRHPVTTAPDAARPVSSISGPA